MVNQELLRGQKLLGWVLMLAGLLFLILLGWARSLQSSYSLPVLGAIASWDPTFVGVVAWLFLAAGYVFVLSAHLEESLRAIERRLEDRINRLTRELTALQQRIGDRSRADPSADAAGAGPAGGAGP